MAIKRQVITIEQAQILNRIAAGDFHSTPGALGYFGMMRTIEELAVIVKTIVELLEQLPQI
jgi:hypothetical protein